MICYLFIWMIIFIHSNIQSQIIIQPYNVIDTENPESAVFVCWKTIGSAEVYFGTNDFSQNRSGTTKGIHLTGLEPNTRYQYKVVSAGQSSIIGSFRTAPPSGTSFSFAVFGDTQMVGQRETNYLKDLYQNFHPDLLIIAGDIITSDPYSYEHGYSYYDSLFSHVPELFANTILVPVRGNHDEISYYKSFFSMLPDAGLRYIFKYGSAAFIVIDDRDDFVFTRNHFDTTFAAIDATFKIGVCHPPIYNITHPSGWNYYIGSFFERAGGDVHYCGHVHKYLRTYWVKSSDCYGCSAPVDFSTVQKEGYAVYCAAGSPPVGGSGSPANYIASYSYDKKLYSIVTVDSVAQGIYSHKTYISESNKTLFDSFTIDHSSHAQIQARSVEHKNNAVWSCNPNPFHSMTKIVVRDHASLLKNSRIALKVFDAKGRLALSVNNACLNNEMTWNASGMAPGIYIAKLSIGRKKYSRRIILLQ